MPSLAGLKGMLSHIGGIPGRFNTAFREVGGYKSLFANRTVLGAGIGGLYGASGENGSVGGAMLGAIGGAGMARYGGMLMGSAMRSGIGLRGAAMRTASLARRDGMRAGRFIGRTAMSANQGVNKIRGLFR